jgi:hypothetical protein
MSGTSQSDLDYSDLSIFRKNNPRLLSESPLIQASGDLSLSELSLSEQARANPSKLFDYAPEAPSSPDVSTASRTDGDGVGDETILAGGGAINGTLNGEQPADAAKAREDKLRQDLSILKKLNSSFSIYKEALREAQSGTEVIRFLI